MRLQRSIRVLEVDSDEKKEKSDSEDELKDFKWFYIQLFMRYSRIIPDYAANDEEKMRLLRGVFDKIDAFNEKEKANKDVKTSTRNLIK